MPNTQLKRSKSVAERDIKELASTVDDTEIPPLFVEKAKNVFHLLDQGNSGTVNMEGTKLFGDKLRQYGGISEEEAAEIKQFMGDWHVAVTKHPDVKLGLEDFIKTHYVMGATPELRPDFETYIKQTYTKVFHFLDTNHDGIISRQEWRVFYKCLSIHDDDIADASFDAIDLNKNNEMSLEEFVKGGVEFTFSLEHGLYDTFLGPVCDC